MSNGSTKPESVQQLIDMKPRFEIKSRLLAAVREWFSSHGFLEVETPSLILAPAPEEYIEAPAVGDKFLRTSPELEMKRLLAAGYERIYQIGPCFREGEFGKRHRPEYTMLEWYQTGIDYRQLLSFTTGLIQHVVRSVLGTGTIAYAGNSIDVDAPWQVLTVAQAFRKYAALSVEDAIAEGLFEELLIDKVEPALDTSRPAVLIDYPAAMSAFSQLKENDPGSAERWELYLGGIEIANAYGELIEPIVQRQRFAAFTRTRSTYGAKEYPEPTRFLEAIDSGIPACAGCALGIDRLTMLLADTPDIGDVVFPL